MNLGEEYSVNQGLVIFDGRIGYNDSLESKQSAAINEGVLLDESFSDQLGLVFKHLNMAIAAVNQHAYLLNTHIPSLNSLLPLLSTPNTIKQLRKELEDDRDKSIKTASLVNQRLTQLEDRFHVTDLILQTRDKSLDDKFKSIEERSRQAFEKSDIKMRETSDELHLWKENAWKKVSELELKIGQTEKETGWKIDDCCQLLKLRPTEEIVVKIIELQFETKKENETRGSKKKSRDKIDELQINVDAPTKDDVTRLINQIVQMENKIDNIKKSEGFSSGDKLNELIERLDNDHLKFEDFQTMIQSSQQRIEQLHEALKNMENSVLQFNVVEESYNSKLNYLAEGLEFLKNEIDSVARMQHAATQTQYYYGNQYNDSYKDAPGQNLGQKRILDNNSHAYEQFQSFGDEMNNPQSQKGPTMSTSHLGSHLGVSRPREKIEGPLFKQEYSQGSVEHSGKSILPDVRESDGNSQAELDKALQVEKPKTAESNPKNKNQASAGQEGNVNSKTQEDQSVQTQGILHHPASDPNQTEKRNSAMNSNKNTARINESSQKRKSIKQSPRDIKNRDPALDLPKHQQLSHNPNSKNSQGNNMLEGPYPNQFPQPIGTPNSNFGIPPGFLQGSNNPFGGFKQGMPGSFPGTFTSSHQSQSATLSKDEKEKLEKAHQFTEEIGSKLATVPSEMLDLRSRPSIN